MTSPTGQKIALRDKQKYMYFARNVVAFLVSITMQVYRQSYNFKKEITYELTN